MSEPRNVSYKNVKIIPAGEPARGLDRNRTPVHLGSDAYGEYVANHLDIGADATVQVGESLKSNLKSGITF